MGKSLSWTENYKNNVHINISILNKCLKYCIQTCVSYGIRTPIKIFICLRCLFKILLQVQLYALLLLIHFSQNRCIKKPIGIKLSKTSLPSSLTLTACHNNVSSPTLSLELINLPFH